MITRRKRSGIMLARPYEARRLTHPKFGWSTCEKVLVQPKLDGERCVAYMKDGEVVLESSTQLPIQHLNHIREEVKQLFSTVTKAIKLDGELYRHATPFEWIASVASQQHAPHAEESSLQYHVFDLNVPAVSQQTRIYFLDGLFAEYPDLQNVVRVRTLEVPCSPESVESEIATATANAYEGIIIRHPRGIYEEKRSSYVMKFKPRSFDTYRIMNFVEAIDKHGTPKGCLGAFVVDSGDCGAFEVGAGTLTQNGREWVWLHQGEVWGKDLVVAYNSKHDSGIPRHAVALSIAGIPDNLLKG